MARTSTTPTLRHLDSFELEARYSNDSGIPYEDISDSSLTFEEFKPFLDRLPPRESDLLELYYRHRKNQKDIARMFGITQGAVSSRLARARERLEFLRDLPKLEEDEVEKILMPYFDPLEVEIIKCMIRTTCQSRTAKIINEQFGLHDERNRMTQVKIRHRFEKCFKVLVELVKEHPELKQCIELLNKIRANLYKLHEVKLPHFDRGYYAVFSMRV